MGVWYIPPNNSDAFELLEEQICKYKYMGQVILMGDFNARTGSGKANECIINDIKGR